MKFLSFVNNGKHTFGAATDAGLVDLGALHPEFRDLRHAIQADRLADLATEAMNADASIDIENVELLPTIPNPEKIICIGVNYAKRNAEYKDGSEAPKYPSVFMRSRDSLVGHEQDIM
ncbi:MAG: 2-hydroxyhepta-2,4-diene-1,7-dioate isomerase, partial [Gammaproteobacteria bacterium]